MMCLTLQHYYKRLEINNGYNYSTSSSMKVIVSQKVAKKAKIFDHLPKMSTFFLRNQSKKRGGRKNRLKNTRFTPFYLMKAKNVLYLLGEI